MTEIDSSPHVLERLRPGDRIQAWERGMLRCTGVVDMVAPELGVVWILESGIGARRMLSVDQYDVRLCAPDGPVGRGSERPADPVRAVAAPRGHPGGRPAGTCFDS